MHLLKHLEEHHLSSELLLMDQSIRNAIVCKALMACLAEDVVQAEKALSASPEQLELSVELGRSDDWAGPAG